MAQFLSFFLINVLGFYLILELTSIQEIVSSFLVEIVKFPITLLGIDYIIEGNVFKLDNATMLIDNECNGLKPIFLFLSALLAYPASLKIKLQWLLYAIFFLQFLNILRIVILTWVLRYHLNNYDLIHDCISPFIMIYIALYFFYIYTNKANKSLNVIKH